MTDTQTETVSADEAEVVEFTLEERNAHAQDEALVDRGIRSFVEVGAALMRIRSRRSYLLTHGTFEEYTEDRWGLGKTTAYETMHASEVVELIEARAPDAPAPPNARVATELARLRADPDRLVEVWAKIVEAHGATPVAREVAEALTKLAPPRPYRRRADKKFEDDPADEEPREPEGDEAAFQVRLDRALGALAEADDAAASAVRTAHVGQADKWLAQVDEARLALRAVRTKVHARARADELRRNRQRRRKATESHG